MQNTQYQRAIDRLNELINFHGPTLVYNNPLMQMQPRTSRDTTVITLDQGGFEEWTIKAEQCLDNVFGRDSRHWKRYFHVMDPLRPNSIDAAKGVLRAAVSDLENGFLTDYQWFVAGDVFASVLEQAKFLNNSGHKDPAAVLARTVIEDAVKRLAERYSLDTANKKVTIINNDLKAAGAYQQPTWRQIQAWLDVGNAAAHGQFEKYTTDDVRHMMDGIELFLANHTPS